MGSGLPCASFAETAPNVAAVGVRGRGAIGRLCCGRSNWYPFVAVNPGRTAIWESYPCSGTGCAAMMALIDLTVVSSGQPNESLPPSAAFPPCPRPRSAQV
jgi:hypothetical protein